MSDLISTPSQTQSTVSNEAFEALIDLLASDGIDENPSNLPENSTWPRANVTLRDSSGKLDFDKIRLMFAAQNAIHRVSTAEEIHRMQPLPVPYEFDGESDEESHSHRSTASTVPSRSHSVSPGPKPIDRRPAGHRRSSTFGNQPWTAIHENATKVEDVAPTLSCQPLSFDELNTALAGAREEVRSLRQQYDVLQALVTKRLGAEIRNQVLPCLSATNTAPDKDEGGGEAPAQAQPSTVVHLVPQSADVPIEISSLSENEAKRALSALARSLNLSLSTLGSMTNPSTLSPQQSLFPPNPTRQHDVASITRALKFLGTVDELVWRRTSAPSGPRTLLPVFSEENIVALVARLELWERAVRRSSRA